MSLGWDHCTSFSPSNVVGGSQIQSLKSDGKNFPSRGVERPKGVWGRWKEPTIMRKNENINWWSFTTQFLTKNFLCSIFLHGTILHLLQRSPRRHWKDRRIPSFESIFFGSEWIGKSRFSIFFVVWSKCKICKSVSHFGTNSEFLRSWFCAAVSSTSDHDHPVWECSAGTAIPLGRNLLMGVQFLLLGWWYFPKGVKCLRCSGMRSQLYKSPRSIFSYRDIGDPGSPAENGSTKPKYHAFRMWIDTLNRDRKSVV